MSAAKNAAKTARLTTNEECAVLERGLARDSASKGNNRTKVGRPKEHRKLRSKLRLYVWTGVFVDYTSGIAFALAYDADHARKLIAKSYVDYDRAMKELAGDPDGVYSRPHGDCCSGGG